MRVKALACQRDALLFLEAGAAEVTAQYELAAGRLGPGKHRLRVVAYEGTGVRTQGYAEVPIMVRGRIAADGGAP